VHKISHGKKWSAEHDPPVSSLAFSPDSRTLASASRGIKIWELAAGRQERILTGHKAGISSLAFGPTGKLLASGSGVWRAGTFHKGEIKLWNLATGEELATVFAHSKGVDFLAISSDGRFLASASSSGKEVILWKLVRKNLDK
jgi:WD40 repeat protein